MQDMCNHRSITMRMIDIDHFCPNKNIASLRYIYTHYWVGCTCISCHGVLLMLGKIAQIIDRIYSICFITLFHILHPFQFYFSLPPLFVICLGSTGKEIMSCCSCGYILIIIYKFGSTTYRL